MESRHNPATDARPRSSSSFLIGAATTAVFTNYGYGCDEYHEFEDDVIVMGELPQLGTIYPQEYKECWEAM